MEANAHLRTAEGLADALEALREGEVDRAERGLIRLAAWLEQRYIEEFRGSDTTPYKRKIQETVS